MRIGKLDTKIIGKKIKHFESVSSTNDIAWQEAINGSPEGTVICADYQTQGRGRLGRKWLAPKGSSILASVILRPQIEAAESQLVTVIGTLAICDTIENVTGIKTLVRFPNDCVINGRKVAGVLVESRFISGRQDLFILGVGINVNIRKTEFGVLSKIATSLNIETGKDISCQLLLKNFIEALDKWYETLHTRDFKRISNAWRDRSYILGKKVVISQNGGTASGVVSEIDPIAGIVLRTEQGMLHGFKGEHITELRLHNSNF